MSKIAVLLADDFEDSEFSVPRDRLQEAGHELTIIGSEANTTVRGKRGEVEAKVTATAESLYPDDFDAVLIPGGYSPDRLRLSSDVVSFVKGFNETGKPVAAICHGPQLLIEAEIVRDRTVTSWPSVRKDLINAGAVWIDQEVVTDGNLITSRKPDDLDAFCNSLLERL